MIVVSRVQESVCTSCPTQHIQKKNTIENMRQASDWTLVHFGVISLLTARPLSQSQTITKGGPERVFMMECRLVRLLLLVTAARKLDSAHATSATTLISWVQHVTEGKRRY